MKASNVRLTAGLLALPAILLQSNSIGIAVQALYVIGLAITHGRKFRLLPNVLLLLSVSSAHLLQPNGLLLYSLGNFPITLGALVLGMRKALTLIALLYLSHYMVTGKPEFPGKLGKLISLQFYYFEQITRKWKSITPKRPFIGAIDTLMLSLTEAEEDLIVTQNRPATADRRSIGINGVHLVILWSIFILGELQLLPSL